MSRAVKLVVDQLIRDLENRPSDFSCSRLTLSDSKTKRVYWVAMGPGIYEPYILSFGLCQGRRFISALDKWKASNMIALSAA